MAAGITAIMPAFYNYWEKVPTLPFQITSHEEVTQDTFVYISLARTW